LIDAETEQEIQNLDINLDSKIEELYNFCKKLYPSNKGELKLTTLKYLNFDFSN